MPAKDCSEYRSMSLISHAFKVSLTIINTKLYCKLEEDKINE